MMIEGNQPCVCGHIKDFHRNICNLCHVMKISYLTASSFYYKDPCTKFKLDNLKYLERLYDANHTS